MSLRIKVELSPMLYGGVTLRPLVGAYAVRFCKIVASNGGPSLKSARRDNYSAYIQDTWDLTADDIGARALRMILAGRDCVVLMDPWVLGHYYGFDAHTLAENGMTTKGMNL